MRELKEKIGLWGQFKRGPAFVSPEEAGWRCSGFCGVTAALEGVSEGQWKASAAG